MNQGRWRGIYTPPGILAVGEVRGQIFPGRISAQNLWDPSREETPKRLSKNSTGKLPGPELPSHRKFLGELPGRSSGTPPERNPKNDLVNFSLGRNFRRKVGTSAHWNFRPKGRNFWSCKGRKPLQSNSLLHFRSCLRSFHLLGLTT